MDSAAKYLGKQIPGRGKATFTKHFVSALLVTAPLILPLKKAAKKLVESKRFRQAMNIMLAANEAFETGFLSPAQLLSTVRTYASDGHFDDPAREYLRHEQAPCFGIKRHAGRRDQAISDHHSRPTR